MEPNKDYRTFQINIKNGHKMYTYFDELCLNSNNLYNTTNFFIRQVFTALNNEGALQPLQQEVIKVILDNINKMNVNQQKAYLKRIEKEQMKPRDEQKEIKVNLFELPSKEKSFLGYNFLDCLFKTIKQKDYYSLPGQINQQVLRNVVQNWTSFFASLKDFKKNPGKYQGRPSIPSYLPKGSRKESTLSNQICKIKDGKFLSFPKTKRKINIGKLANFNGTFQQVRIIPKHNCFTIELVFLIELKKQLSDKTERCMSIDLGLDNVAALVFNTENVPVLFKGGKVKSINQWYNKMRGYYYAALRNGKNLKEGNFHSQKLVKLDSARHRQIKDFFHKVSFNIVRIAVENNIDTIVIGKNVGWKQKIELGKRNNQNFVQVPHSLLLELITYKANAEGISVIVTEESYTSQASFLDDDIIPTYKSGNNVKQLFSGKRLKRGIYRTKNNFLINADVNGAANILRKVVPKAFANGIAAVCSQPQVVNVR